jgi:N-dimethylarginine dimethylaminohydrolase
MAMQQPQPPIPAPISVNIRSEFDPLKTVVMCWANAPTFGTVVDMISSMFDPAVRRQLRHNRWRYYKNKRVHEQQQQVVRILRDHGVTVLFLDNMPGVCSQHYTRDIGFCIDETFFLARMGTTYREPEQRVLTPLLPRLSKVVRLEKGRIEGGDVMLYDDKLLVGLGEATNREGVDELQRTLAALGNHRELVPIAFTHPGVIHLDTKFNIVGRHLALCARNSFSPDTIRWFEQHFDLIEATEDEVRNLEINTFSIGHGHVLMHNKSERLASLLQQRGLSPILVDYSEVIQWPGSFRCTTLPIERTAS